MLSRRIRWQLRVFGVITALAVSAVAIFYLRVPEALGIGRYTVTADFAASGGLYPNANVTYRGSTVGRVTAVEVTDDLGVAVRMRLRSDTAIPADVIATARSVSAVGEQYVDLVPSGDEAGPVLRDGSVIDRSHTRLSGSTAELLRKAQNLVDSLDRSRLGEVLRETAAAFDQSGPELARLIRSSAEFLGAVNGSRDDATELIEQLGAVLDTQIRSGEDITALADGLARFTDELRDADPQLRTMLQTAPGTAETATDTFTGIRPSFPMLAANLANFGRIGVIYRKSLEQTLVVLPAVTAVLITAAEQVPPDEGVKVDFKLGLDDPPPCNVGFIPPSQIRSPGDQTLREIPDDMYCKVPQSSPLVVRGARNYPCQEFPGKRAPTVALCRDPAGYIPLGNQPWRGPVVPEDTAVTDPRNVLPPNKYPHVPPGADYDPGPPVTELPPGVPPGPGPAPYAPYPLPVPPVTPGPPPPPLPYDPPPDHHVPPYGQNGPAVAVYDPANGLFQEPGGRIGVFAAADARLRPAENWVDLFLGPQRVSS
jgi:phospholipid/cholesterol/gamma-HCH transport system substrate-binding protein